MSKKKKSKDKEIRKGLAKPSHKGAQIEKEEEKPFDFGGIPDRDLKKNLGCG
jgi:hypothetical protein